VSDRLRSAALQLRAARRVVGSPSFSIRLAVAPLDDRMVFVVGSPRSGTTFLGRAIGSCPGFVDLGEIEAHKAAIPELAALSPEEAAPAIRRTLRLTRRLALVGGLRAVEQTPESVFVAPGIALAFPQAQIVHIVRDGRDVVCSLLDRGWLSAHRHGHDHVGNPLGSRPRFWVEAGREAAFAAASDARRAAWAWRRHVEAAQRVGERAHELRYERLSADPVGAADALAAVLDAPAGPLAHALQNAFASSVGRFRRDLTHEQLAEVEDEAGALLRELGYLQSS
jgi:Sulfotransferase family